MSSTRTALAPFYVLQETAVAANKTSVISDIAGSDVVQYDVEWVNGSLDFDATIEIDVLSSLENTTVESAWKWNTLSYGGSTPQMTGASGTHNIILKFNPFAKIRARVVHSAGTGDVKISIKGNGN
jgi:hypothetical protein